MTILQNSELSNSEQTQKTLREPPNDALGMEVANNHQEAKAVITTIQKAPANAKKLSESLRSSGYNNYQAIEDIMDNCFDADSKEIAVEIKVKSGPRGGVGKFGYDSVILIKDKGIGMPKPILVQALTYGSETPHDSKRDRGVFGMGLKTAGTSLCRQITVLTRTSKGELLKGVLDLDLIEEYNDFVIDFPTLTPEDEKLFNEWAGSDGSGTIIKLSKIDRISNTNPEQFTNILRGPRHLGRTFRYMLDTKKITVNGEAVKPWCPLQWTDSTTEKWTKGWKKVPIETINGQKGTLLYRIGQRHSKTAGKLEGVQRGQGWVFVRSNREIARTGPLGIWTPGNDTYGLFIEAKWEGSFLDPDLAIEFTKTKVEMSVSLLDRMKNELAPIMKSIKASKLAKKLAESKSTKKMDEVLKTREDLNKTLSGLLDLPEYEQKIDVSFQANPNGRGQSANNNRRRGRNGGTVKRSNSNWTRKYDFAPFSRLGPCWDADWDRETETVTILLNEDHPFILKAINAEGSELMDATLDVLDSLIMAEGKIIDDDEQKLWERSMGVFGNNLRVYATHETSE